MRGLCFTLTALLLATGCRGTNRCDDGFVFDESGDCVSTGSCPGGRDPVTGRCTGDGDAGGPDAGPVDGGLDAGPTRCERPLDCDDGVFCNGIELCDPTSAMADALGCLPAADVRCLASQTCDEDMDRCQTMCDIDPDADGDGVNALECGGTDCDDADMDRFPGNTEVCDVLDHDEDCDPSTFGVRDGDMDGAPDAACCNVDTDGTTLICGTDCDDGDMGVNPGATELCNMVDDDCNGMVDDSAAASCVLSETMMAACTAGACVPTICNSGFGNCDADDGNGCEQDIDSSDAHCGMCGNVCGECETCSGGSCVPTTDGGSCMSGSGQCRSGACCTGCWDGATCQAGTAPAACGGGGGLCESCPCASDTCASGACAPVGGGVRQFDVSAHACAVLTDDRLYCWGRNSEGQLGLGDSASRVSPIQVLPGTAWRQVDAGGQHSCAIDTSWAAFCWGDNSEGQLGTGGTISTNLPTRTMALTAINQITAGRRSAATTGALYEWGQMTVVPTLVSLGIAWVEVDACLEQSPLFARRMTGTLWTVDFLSTGVAQLGTATDWSDVDAGIFNGCALNTSGELWCIGDNSNGSLGTGGGGFLSELTRVGTRSNWVDVSLDERGMCAVNTLGELYCNSTTSAARGLDASRVGERTDWADAQVGSLGWCVTRTDGSLWCFTDGDLVGAMPSRICFP